MIDRTLLVGKFGTSRLTRVAFKNRRGRKVAGAILYAETLEYNYKNIRKQ